MMDELQFVLFSVRSDVLLKFVIKNVKIKFDHQNVR